MVEEELIGQQRDIAGTPVGTCDGCGRTMERTALTTVTEAHPAVEQTEEFHLCAECRAALERGEITLHDTDDEPQVTKLI